MAPPPPISRTDPCPCGSGRRYKHCCGATVAPAAVTPPATSDGAFRAAQALHQAGRVVEAERMYRQILETEQDSPRVLHYLGVCCYQRGDHDDAAAHIRAALARNPREPMAQNNLGLVYRDQRRFAEALECFDKALEQDPANAIVYNNRGLVLQELGRPRDAISDFRRATSLRDNFAEAFSNLAKVLLEERHLAEALDCCDRAIALNPGLATAHAVRGSVLRKMERYEEAFVSWDRALALKPDFADVLVNRGHTFQEAGRLDDAIASFTRALALNPGLPQLKGATLQCRMYQCDWAQFETEAAAIVAAIDRGVEAASPFVLLSLPATPAEHQRAARLSIGDRFPSPSYALQHGRRYDHDRIRVAYLSADFRDHPTSHLIAGLIERHDRSRFEVTGIYFGPSAVDEWRTLLERRFDRFVDVRTTGDDEAAALLRSLEIDIVVDLMAHTAYGRTGLLARRPAPVQVNYLGYPGTMGAPFVDYLIADATVIPPEHRQFYDEKIAYVPHSYQVNDSTKRIADSPVRRADLGLPDDAFVFCCFNNAYKITPDVFDVWMRLLLRVPKSVFWLLRGDDAAVRNLQREARLRGVSPDRLVFAPRVPVPEHLARHRCADLFVDTFYYNAHTTASDALWAGLPVVTCRGGTFPSRVAASLLGAIGMPELVTTSRAGYEALALELALDPGRLAGLRRTLAANRTTQPLFDTAMWTRHIEDVYVQMHARHHAGLPPDHIVVAARH